MKYSKIKSIKKIGIGITYDLEVPKYNNFYLSNGILSHNSIELDARYGISYFLAAQNIDSMPEGIQRNCRWIFIPSTLDVQSIRQVLISSGSIKYVQRATNTAMKLKQQLKRVKFSWIVINRTDGSMTLITPLSPLSEHLESSL